MTPKTTPNPASMAAGEAVADLLAFLENPSEEALLAGYHASPALADDVFATDTVRTIFVAVLRSAAQEYTAGQLV